MIWAILYFVVFFISFCYGSYKGEDASDSFVFSALWIVTIPILLLMGFLDEVHHFFRNLR